MRSRLFAAALAAAALPAFATPQQRNLTDMWFNPAEPGWGLNIIHQGDTLFATLFVFGPDGQPKWYVASNASGGPSTYSGALLECAGPTFTGTFDPRNVSCRQAGAMTFSANDAGGSLDYTVDGVRVTKQVSRFSFRAGTIAGTYAGFMYSPELARERRFSIEDDGSNVTMSTVPLSTSGGGETCTWTGTHGQNGRYENVAGSFSCGSRSGTWSMTADPTSEGITGSFSGDAVNGRIAAARIAPLPARGNEFHSDMWFVPAESGWGLNVIEQGTTQTHVLFATLFVYDAQGRAHWYVAPAVERHDLGGNEGDVSYLGSLFEVTGPYFGTSFNPSAVSQRAVGTLLFHAQGFERAIVTYSVNGATVGKNVERFAFRRNDLSGSYFGHLVADNFGSGPENIQSVGIVIDDGSSFAMRTAHAGGITCDYAAPLAQSGQLRSMTGTFSCTNGTGGSFTMTNATVSAEGFTARFQGNGIASGHIAGVRR